MDQAANPSNEALMARYQARLDAEAMDQIVSRFVAPAVAVGGEVLVLGPRRLHGLDLASGRPRRTESLEGEVAAQAQPLLAVSNGTLWGAGMADRRHEVVQRVHEDGQDRLHQDPGRGRPRDRAPRSTALLSRGQRLRLLRRLGRAVTSLALSACTCALILSPCSRFSSAL